MRLRASACTAASFFPRLSPGAHQLLGLAARRSSRLCSASRATRSLAISSSCAEVFVRRLRLQLRQPLLLRLAAAMHPLSCPAPPRAAPAPPVRLLARRFRPRLRIRFRLLGRPALCRRDAAPRRRASRTAQPLLFVRRACAARAAAAPLRAARPPPACAPLLERRRLSRDSPVAP